MKLSYSISILNKLFFRIISSWYKFIVEHLIKRYVLSEVVLLPLSAFIPSLISSLFYLTPATLSLR